VIVLDTDVFSATRRPERAPAVAAWVARQRPGTLVLSVVTVGEVERGIAREDGRNPPFAADLRAWLTFATRSYAERILPFEDQDARTWGRLSATLGHSGPDLMIAATALARGLAVATRNVVHFAPTGVRIINPFEP
jgi:predicted nucleic acid-binding protein